MDMGLRRRVESRLSCFQPEGRPNTKDILSYSKNHQIHVDRYKHDVYMSLTDDPFMKAIVTKELGKTRFHACERFSRCNEVNYNDPSVVYINMVNINCENWKLYRDQTKAQIDSGTFPTFLVSFILVMGNIS